LNQSQPHISIRGITIGYILFRATDSAARCLVVLPLLPILCSRCCILVLANKIMMINVQTFLGPIYSVYYTAFCPSARGTGSSLEKQKAQIEIQFGANISQGGSKTFANFQLKVKGQGHRMSKTPEMTHISLYSWRIALWSSACLLAHYTLGAMQCASTQLGGRPHPCRQSARGVATSLLHVLIDCEWDVHDSSE